MSIPPAPPPPKRPTRSDGKTTYDRILESAGRLFAEHGYAKTTSKTVAAASGVDLASINYHFVNRDGLYQAVLIEAHRRFVSLADLEAIARSERSPEDRLMAVISLLLGTTIEADHWGVRVFLRELAAPSPHIAVLRNEEVLPKLKIVLSILSDITGIPVNEPVLICSLISVAAPCAMMLLHRADLPWAAFGTEAASPEAMVGYLHRFIVGGLQATARAHGL